MIDFNQDLILDGGMGSSLLERGYIGLPEKLNLTSPEVIEDIHISYVKSGADVVYTNTFGANCFKYGDELDKIISAAISIAKRSGARYTALDIGPLGKIVGEGGISFDEAYEEFKRIILSAGDKTDYIAIETITSLTEARAAVLAAKENSTLPVCVTMSFEKNLRTFFGVDIHSFVLTMEAMGVNALGANCSVGPVQMEEIAKKLLECASVPVVIKPNAGMPSVKNGKTVYDVDEKSFAENMAKIKGMGANILGGCCGTTPAHIALTAERTKAIEAKHKKAKGVWVCSAYKAVSIDGHTVVGERINPTGKKKVQAALRADDYDFLVSEGIKQEKQNAAVLDVNVGVSGIDETKAMLEMIKRLSKATTLPLQIDSSKPEVIEKALRYYDGVAIVNSVNGSNNSLCSILPLVKKYGAAVIGLTMDENGIPDTVEGRLKIADKIIKTASKYGIDRSKVIIDALTMAESSAPGTALVTLGTVEALTKAGIKTALGVSNVSFGMPSREIINASFYDMAKSKGLTLAIINPAMSMLSGSDDAVNFLLAKPDSAGIYIENTTPLSMPVSESKGDLADLIVTGQADSAREETAVLLNSLKPMEVAEKYVMPALNEIGKLYEEGKVFLPQLIASSDAAKAAFEVIEEALGDKKEEGGVKTFVIATVKGDIHDIGKNIVKAITSNYGYKVIDLGRDVDYQTVVDAVKRNYPCVLGLSALMTTTAENMATQIKLVKEEFDIPVFCGGAVLTPEYAEQIGGIYCKDAQDTVKKLSDFFARNPAFVKQA